VAGAAAGVWLDLVGARVPAATGRAEEVADHDGAGAAASAGAPSSPAPPAGPRPDGRVPRPTVELARSPAAAPSAVAPAALELVGTGLVGALTLGLAAVRLGVVPALGAYCALFAGLVALSVVDVRVGLLPRVILYPTAGLMTAGLVAASAVGHQWDAIGRAAVSAAAALLVFFGIWWVFPRGLGFGDVRLAGVMAAGLGWLGFRQVYVGFVAGFLLGAVIGVVKMVVQGTGRRTRLPFGPALAAGCMVGVLWGTWLSNVWLSHPA
jgi:leader peptidase (prepilin peptidase)/N-methyltransferase